MLLSTHGSEWWQQQPTAPKSESIASRMDDPCVIVWAQSVDGYRLQPLEELEELEEVLESFFLDLGDEALGLAGRRAGEDDAPADALLKITGFRE